ncbi:hypothetical protein M436DRAFT_66279 [Aureobasidium namibiae CBS 147.97]|uniref:Uncharacterized protein n=1 Tax=Aureobasidium namibiae CBS 147.97 TaxID=1043004 RepID=A0A074WKJ2_9PEZI
MASNRDNRLQANGSKRHSKNAQRVYHCLAANCKRFQSSAVPIRLDDSSGFLDSRVLAVLLIFYSGLQILRDRRRCSGKRLRSTACYSTLQASPRVKCLSQSIDWRTGPISKFAHLIHWSLEHRTLIRTRPWTRSTSSPLDNEEKSHGNDGLQARGKTTESFGNLVVLFGESALED